MDDIYGIRRRNLDRLLALPDLAAMTKKLDKAVRLEMSASMFSQLVNPTYKIGDDLARRIEASMGLETGWMDNAPAESQPVGMDGSKMSQALVSIDKALRELRLEMNVAYIGNALIAAYLERLKLSDVLDKDAYALYDRLVLEQLRGMSQQHEQGDRQALGASQAGAGKAKAKGKEIGGSAARRKHRQ